MKDNGGLITLLMIGAGAWVIWQYVIPAMQQSAAQATINTNVANLSTQIATVAPSIQS